jgi:hypothetical protein
MAYSQAAKAETHERILRVAAERLRQTGIDRLSITPQNPVHLRMSLPDDLDRSG